MSTRSSHGAHSTRLKLSRRPSRRRLFVVLLCLVALFAGVTLRLVFLQVVSRADLAQQSSAQRIRTVTLSSSRGSIFDRNGNDLAMSIPQQTVWADPQKVQDKAQTAAALAPVLGTNVDEITQKLSAKSRFAYIQRKVSDDVADRIKDLKLEGIYMYEEPKRVLAGKSMLSSVVGQVGVDNEGLSGLEKSYEKTLAGSPGRVQLEEDLTGKNIPGGMREMVPAVAGSDIVLTVDRDLQNKVEQVLSEAIRRTLAKGGMAAVMDVKTGEILALSNLENVAPLAADGQSRPTGENRIGAVPGSEVRAASHNMAVTDVYEPGSVSKIVTIAGALEAGLVSPTTMFNVSDSMQIYDAKFKDAEPHQTYSWSTTDILTASSNIGTIAIAQKLGKDRLDSFQRAFGYGSKPGLKIQDESAGIVVPPKKYSGTTLATSAIGQGVSVTTIQMLAAYNTIANKGTYVAPKLVRATIDGKGKMHETQKSPTRAVISEQTASQMNLMMQEVVRVGTATAAKIDGYPTAGKTGTAKKLATDRKGYKDGAYIATFSGFAPANDPRFTAIVVLDEPTPIYGGLVSAPVFAEISRYILQERHIAPSEPQSDRMGVPFASTTASSAADESGVAGTTAEKAKALAENANAEKHAEAVEPGGAPNRDGQTMHSGVPPTTVPRTSSTARTPASSSAPATTPSASTLTTAVR